MKEGERKKERNETKSKKERNTERKTDRQKERKIPVRYKTQSIKTPVTCSSLNKDKIPRTLASITQTVGACARASEQ